MIKRVILFICLGYPLMSVGQEAADTLTTFQLRDLVVTASRLEEDLSTSPVTIEKVSERAFSGSPSPSFFDALQNVKGVQMLIPSLGFKVINTRGFGNTTNVRFVQMVDGMDNQAPHLGAPVANMLGPSDLDILSVEIIPGTASALYGMNAINGLANFVTKDPFTTKSLTVQQKVGINRLNEEGGGKLFSESNFRWSRVVSNKLAFKVNGTYVRGADWIANDSQDLNKSANISTGLLGISNPAYDPVNSYGNESPNRRTLLLNGKNYVVGRTGYYEKEVVEYSIRNFKADAAIHYAMSSGKKLVYTYRFANLDNIYQRSNRFRLDDYQMQQHGLAFKSKSLQLLSYINLENTGNSYNARSMAENMDRYVKTDDQWFSDYSTAFNTAVEQKQSIAEAHAAARLVSDQGRPQPGTATFNDIVGRLATINNWDYGAALRVKARMFHAEGQLNLNSSFLQNFKRASGVDLLVGFDHRMYVIVPDGNYFINPEGSGNNLTYSKTGAFVKASKSLGDKLILTATLRADKNEYYKVRWNPRVTAVYSMSNSHHIRMSFQNGFRFPSVFEAFSNVNSGGVKRVGGLPIMSSGIFENAFKRASIDKFQASVLNDINQSGLSKNEAIVKNQNLLDRNDYSYVVPEEIRSIEIGYRGFFVDEALQIDLDFYYNRYHNFIAQVEMNVPQTTVIDSLPFYMNDRRKQDRYRMWTNSKTIAYNYGAGFGFIYKAARDFEFKGNASYAKLERSSKNDGLEDGFNTPEWMFTISSSNENLYKNFGFSIAYRWQSNYYWQSFLVNGNVPAYQTIDAQISKKFAKSRFKIGGSNIFNRYYQSFLGGPSIGGFYYAAITYNMN